MGLQSWDDEFAAMLYPDSSDEAPLPWTDVGQLPEEGLIDFHDIVLPMESAAEPLAAGLVEEKVSVPEPLFVATGANSQETSVGCEAATHYWEKASESGRANRRCERYEEGQKGCFTRRRASRRG